MNSITPKELKQRLANGEKWQLVDVREGWERDAFNIGGLHIALQEIVTRIDEIETDIPVVFYCQKGIRSSLAIQRLMQKRDFINLFNLSGGMAAWNIQVLSS